MVEKLTDDEIREYKAAFTLLDEAGSGKIEKNQVGVIFRQLGYNPSENQVQHCKDLFTTEESDQNEVDFIKFLDMMAELKELKTKPVEGDIVKAFKVFDRDMNGFISAAELRNVMTTIGEGMTDEEVDELIAQTEADNDGMIHYEEFIQRMFALDTTHT